MSYSFRPAVREGVGILVGLAGSSGSGKTFSAMLIAEGVVGKGNKFAVIDTENRRSLHYAPTKDGKGKGRTFNFDMCELNAPYTPEKYSDSIQKAIDNGYKAIVVDSMTHEHSGEGGVLEHQQEILEDLIKRAKEREPNTPEYKLEERYKMKAWIKPKMARKKLIEKLLKASTNIPIIVCFRAEEKTVMHKEHGKATVASEWAPVCGKEFPFEMTAFFMLFSGKPGVPSPIKLNEQHRDIFPLDKPIDADCGKRMAEWAKGGVTQEKVPQKEKTDSPPADNGRDKKLIEIMSRFAAIKISGKKNILKKVSGILDREIKSSLKLELTDQEIDTLLNYFNSL